MSIKQLLQEQHFLTSEINNKKFDKDTVMKLVRLNRELAEVNRKLSFYTPEEIAFYKNELEEIYKPIPRKQEETKKLEIEDDTLFYILIGLMFNNKPFKLLQFLNLIKSFNEHKKGLQNKII